MKIKILTDTSADFSEKELTQNNLTEIKMPVSLDGVEQEDIALDKFWKELISGKVARTSQPSRSVLIAEFEKAKKDKVAVVFVTISSKLSGTYETAISAKEEVGYDEVYIINSLTATVGEKFLVMEAVKMANNSKSAQEIAERLEYLKGKVKLYACIDTLKYLARGGRISKATAALGNVLNLKPVIEVIDGEIKVINKALGKAHAFKHIAGLVKNVDENYLPIPIFAYDKTNCETFISKLQTEKIITKFDKVTTISPVIGTYIGPGGFGIVYIEK